MNILVTGGAGFIGKNLLSKLVEDGHSVTSLDFEHVDIEGVHSIRGDVTYFGDCVRACYGIDVVYHLAAKARIPNSYKIPDEYYDANVHGTLNVVKACIECSVGRLIFSSSSTVYGESTVDTFIAEDRELAPLNWYGVSKQIAENIIKHYPNAPDYVIARFFTVYGDGQPTDDENALVFGKFLNAKKANKALFIHGDGSQTRDFIDVRDVVDALLVLGKSKYVNETYNIGTGRSVSINYLAKLFKHDTMNTTALNGYPSHTKANIFKMYLHHGWMPTHTLEDGVKRMLER